MPYVIEWCTPECSDRSHDEIGRVATATLDEARRNADALCLANPSLPDADTGPVVDACWEIPEAGGSVGPLPDGTTIQVERRPWSWMWEQVDCPERKMGETADEVHVRLLAAWNAKQEADRA